MAKVFSLSLPPPLSREHPQIPYLGDRRPQRRHDDDVVERRVAAGVGSGVAGGALLGLEKWVERKEKEKRRPRKKLSQLEIRFAREREGGRETIGAFAGGSFQAFSSPGSTMDTRQRCSR